MLRQVAGARAYDLAHRADPRSDQRRVGERADAHRYVETFLDEVDRPVEQQHAHVDARVAAQEVADEGEHVQASERGGCGDSKLALRLALRAGELRLRRVDLFDDAAAGLEILSPLLGEREPARRPRDETGAEVILERREFAADGGQRHAEPAPGGRQAARIGNRREETHGTEPVHSIVPKFGIIFSKRRLFY